MISKALLMPLLAILLILSTGGMKSQFKVFILLALCFSWFGDLYLIQSEIEIYFLFGLVAFLIAHIFYTIAFVKCKDVNHEIPIVKKYPLFGIGFLAIGAGVFIKIKDNLGDMEIPVLVYIAAIILMGVMALNRYNKVEKDSFWLILLGALLFIFSDSIIAFNKFNGYIPNARVYIMTCYILAQYLITRGAIRQVISVNKRDKKAPQVTKPAEL